MKTRGGNIKKHKTCTSQHHVMKIFSSSLSHRLLNDSFNTETTYVYPINFVNKVASSSINDVEPYIITRQLPDSIFIILAVLTCQWEIRTYIHKTFLSQCCIHKVWWTLVRYYPRIFLEGLRKTTRNLRQDSLCLTAVCNEMHDGRWWYQIHLMWHQKLRYSIFTSVVDDLIALHVVS